ncbi:MAG: T9SS type A sorting domain-containing protein, partial [Bacteroidota bacterium]
VVLSPSGTTTSAPSRCKQNPWTFYFNAANPNDLLFAVEKFPSGAGANTNDFTGEASITVSSSPQTGGGTFFAESLGGATQQATFVMGRYWNFNLTSGSLNGTVNVRFFYDDNELTTLTDTAQGWNNTIAGGSAVESGIMWFKTQGVDFDHTLYITASGLSNSIQLTPAGFGTVDGVRYVQFDGVSSFSGGSAAFTVGVNSVFLPIELLHFDATKRGSDVLLTWSTASEINNDFFTIERSSDRFNWEVVAIVDGAGNSSTQLDYLTWDREPLPGVSYYRLKQTDFNGAFEYSDLRKVVFDGQGNGLSIKAVPNPSFGEVNVNVNSVDENEEIQVFLMETNGKLVRQMRSRTQSGVHRLFFGDLAAGTYFLKVVGLREMAVEKLVVH